MKKTFIAYPSTPPLLGQAIETAAASARSSGTPEIKTWRELDIPGHFIGSEVLRGIEQADLFVADITRLNFNVTFEIGYAIGRGRRVILVQNAGLQPVREELDQLGLFDTLGWSAYSSSTDLLSLIDGIDDLRGLRQIEKPILNQAPVYLLEPLHKDDASVHIISRLKKTRLRFRSHDPKEQSRLSAAEATLNVATSAGVVMRLLSNERTDFWFNNLRAAFVAGVGTGLGRELLILQEPATPVPLDYRDLVAEFRDNLDIERHIGDFAPRIVEALQAITPAPLRSTPKLLEKVSLGASAAENEFTFLANYYVRTDEFRRAIRGEFRIAAGRKGTGKSALFFQARDTLRQGNSNVILDLKPEGHQFKRLRDTVLARLDGTSQEHLATAFWEYLLTSELAAKCLEKDRKRHLRDPDLLGPYQDLARIFHDGHEALEGDFSERVLSLVQRLSDDFPGWRDPNGGVPKAREIAQFVYNHDLPKLQNVLREYLRLKGEAWILVDNLDKGWPTRGLTEHDLLFLRGLLDATRKLERHLSDKEARLHTIVFLRNDVHELLLSETPDRGKEAKVSLDWTDGDRLRELIRLRVIATSGGFSRDIPFEQLWRTLVVSHVGGEESSELLIENSLMRPRNLINLVEYCRSNAVNLGHDKIEAGDITKGLEAYSRDICAEISLEIRDVFPEVADNALYAFLGAPTTMSLAEVRARVSALGITGDQVPRFVEILLWFSFLGVVQQRDVDRIEHYCHTVHYDMRKLRWLAQEFKQDDTQFSVHRAFRSFLETS